MFSKCSNSEGKRRKTSPSTPKKTSLKKSWTLRVIFLDPKKISKLQKPLIIHKNLPKISPSCSNFKMVIFTLKLIRMRLMKYWGTQTMKYRRRLTWLNSRMGLSGGKGYNRKLTPLVCFKILSLSKIWLLVLYLTICMILSLVRLIHKWRKRNKKSWIQRKES